MDNRDYAQSLSEISALLQIQGANRFRVRAFENAARAISGHPEPIEPLLDDGSVTSISGIGKSIADDLLQIRDRGTCDLLENLLDDLDPGLLKVLKIQGLGPKRVKLIYDELGIATVEALEEACQAGKIRELSGLGARTEEKILAEIDRLKLAGDRIPLPEARRVAESLRDDLAALPQVQAIEIAGSLRRGRETIGDIDLLVATADPEPIHQAFRDLTEVTDVIATGETKTSVRLRGGVQVDLRTVDPEVFGSALHYFTGSKEHHIALRTRAKRMGLKVSEYGVTRIDTDEVLASRTEEDLFAALGLDFIPPELREGRDELDLAADHRLPTLLTADDVRGDLHMHTTETDGRHSIIEMAEAARDLGHSFIAITDHSQDVRVANGMTPDRFARHLDAIAAADAAVDGIRVLSGIEVDILKDGSLDMDDDLLRRADWVIGSVHSHFQLPRDEMTQRLLTAIDSGLLSSIGHPTGRILGGRDGYDFDFEALLDAAAEHRVALEINGSTGRLDLNAELARRAHSRGVPLVLGSDAHSTRGLQDLRFAIEQARRAGLTPDDVLNCLDVDRLLTANGKATL